MNQSISIWSKFQSSFILTQISINGRNGFAGGKKKNGGGDNPEPSSPKVTCIGQVRVKTKRHGNKLRSRSKRRRDVSFRRPEPEGMLQISRSYSRTHFTQQRNQRWVHLPLTICEALRSFGCDLNCLLPCRSTCTSAAGERDRSADSGEDSSCGAAFVRWLVPLQDRDGKRRDIEVTVVDSPPESRRRRHVFEDIDISAEGFEVEVEKKSKVCVPPRNALLLMRCRSDPLKMATLANRFTEKGEDEEEKIKEERHQAYEEEPTTVTLETEHSNNVEEDEQKLREFVPQQQYPEPDLNLNVHESILEKQEAKSPPTQFPAEIKTVEIEETTESESESEHDSEEESETENEVVAEMAGTIETEEEEETETAVNEAGKKSTEEKRVPDCLMMMMSEPKLSMEVSKETWVCSTDFIRRLPEKPPVKTDVQDEPEKRISMDSRTAQPQRNKEQPPRSSCYFPASSKACEPSVLARCKSEPKKSAARLAPDACIWNNRKMEPHRPGIGAAGVGCRSRPVVG